jgi:transposase
MPEWKIGGRDVDGFITSYMCPECGYRIKPSYILKSCPNCHLEMTPDVKPHYNIKGIGDDWYHYELINPERLMKVIIDNEETFTNVTDVWTNDKEHKIRIKRSHDNIYERSFSSFTITSHGKEETNGR